MASYLQLGDGRLVHVDCSPHTKCSACKRRIDAGSSYVEAKGRAFHAECLKCELCGTPLTAFNDDDDPRLACADCTPRLKTTPRAPAVDDDRRRRRRRRSIATANRFASRTTPTPQ
jgi:hypothetical protein